MFTVILYEKKRAEIHLSADLRRLNLKAIDILGTEKFDTLIDAQAFQAELLEMKVKGV